MRNSQEESADQSRTKSIQPNINSKNSFEGGCLVPVQVPTKVISRKVRANDKPIPKVSSRLSNALEQLRESKEEYWCIINNLSKEERGQVFAIIMRGGQLKDLSVLQQRFLTSQLLQIPLLQSISKNFGESVLQNCLVFLKYQEVNSGQTIFEQSDQSTRLFIILEGLVEVSSKISEKRNLRQKKNLSYQVKTLFSGEAFGESGMLNDNVAISATIRTITHCTFAILEKYDFTSVLGVISDDRISQRCQFIKQYPFFEDLANRELLFFGYHFNEVQYKRGEVVYEALDEKTEDVFFVKEGNFILQGAVQNKKSNVKNLKFKRNFTFTNLYPLVQRVIFGFEAFNPGIIQSFEQEISEIDKDFFEILKQKRIEESDFQTFRIGRVLCESTRGTLYRVNAQEIEHRLWREESRMKFQHQQSMIFEKQIQKIKNVICRHLELKCQQEMNEEYNLFVKQPVEYLGQSPKFEGDELISPENKTQTDFIIGMQTIQESSLNIVKQDFDQILRRDSFKKADNLLPVEGQQNAHNTSQILLLNPLNEQIPSRNQQIGVQCNNSQSPFRMRSLKQCSPLKSIENPRKEERIYKKSLLNDIKKNINIRNKKSESISEGASRMITQSQTLIQSQQEDNIMRGSINKYDLQSSGGNISKCQCIMRVKQSDQSNRISHPYENPRDTLRHSICESEDEFNYTALKNVKQSYQEEGDQTEGVVVKGEFKQSTDIGKLIEDDCYISKELSFDGKRGYSEEFSSVDINYNDRLPTYEKSTQESCQQEFQTNRHPVFISSEVSENQLSLLGKKKIRSQSTPKEVLDEMFFFCGDRNEAIKRSRKMRELKRAFAGECEQRSSSRHTAVRGIGDSSSEQDTELEQATSLEQYKRLVQQRELRDKQGDKFKKLFSHDIVQLAKFNETSLYNMKVQHMYKQNLVEDQFIFGQTANVVREHSCSFIQVREHFNKLNHTDRYFQDIFIRRNNSSGGKSGGPTFIEGGEDGTNKLRSRRSSYASCEYMPDRKILSNDLLKNRSQSNASPANGESILHKATPVKVEALEIARGEAIAKYRASNIIKRLSLQSEFYLQPTQKHPSLSRGCNSLIKANSYSQSVKLSANGQKYKNDIEIPIIRYSVPSALQYVKDQEYNSLNIRNSEKKPGLMMAIISVSEGNEQQQKQRKEAFPKFLTRTLRTKQTNRKVAEKINLNQTVEN